MHTGTFMGSWSVRESMILIAATSSGSSALAPLPGLLGSTMRLSEKTTSPAVTGLPLWKVSPGRSRTVHSLASARRRHFLGEVHLDVAAAVREPHQPVVEGHRPDRVGLGHDPAGVERVRR